jgi:hypothetical protein
MKGTKRDENKKEKINNWHGNNSSECIQKKTESNKKIKNKLKS